MVGRMDKNNNNIINNVVLESLDNQIKSKEKEGMKDALNVFQRVTQKVANKVAVEANRNPALQEALYSANNPHRAPNMVYEGYETSKPVMPVQKKYAAFAIPNQSGKNRWDIANEADGSKVVGNLYLSESATAIVALLNKGVSFYSPQVRQILEFEDKYSKHYTDAIAAKRRIKNNSEHDAVMETKFQEAKNKAYMIKENLVDYVSKIL